MAAAVSRRHQPPAVPIACLLALYFDVDGSGRIYDPMLFYDQPLLLQFCDWYLPGPSSAAFEQRYQKWKQHKVKDGLTHLDSYMQQLHGSTHPAVQTVKDYRLTTQAPREGQLADLYEMDGSETKEERHEHGARGGRGEFDLVKYTISISDLDRAVSAIVKGVQQDLGSHAYFTARRKSGEPWFFLKSSSSFNDMSKPSKNNTQK